MQIQNNTVNAGWGMLIREQHITGSALQVLKKMFVQTPGHRVCTELITHLSLNVQEYVCVFTQACAHGLQVFVFFCFGKRERTEI